MNNTQRTFTGQVEIAVDGFLTGRVQEGRGTNRPLLVRGFLLPDTAPAKSYDLRFLVVPEDDLKLPGSLFAVSIGVPSSIGVYHGNWYTLQRVEIPALHAVDPQLLDELGKRLARRVEPQEALVQLLL